LLSRYLKTCNFLSCIARLSILQGWYLVSRTNRRQIWLSSRVVKANDVICASLQVFHERLQLIRILACLISMWEQQTTSRGNLTQLSSLVRKPILKNFTSSLKLSTRPTTQHWGDADALFIDNISQNWAASHTNLSNCWALLGDSIDVQGPPLHMTTTYSLFVIKFCSRLKLYVSQWSNHHSSHPLSIETLPGYIETLLLVSWVTTVPEMQQTGKRRRLF